MHNNQDLIMHKAMKKLLEDATFPLKSREVVAFVKVMEWFDNLPLRFFEETKEKESSKGINANKRR